MIGFDPGGLRVLIVDANGHFRRLVRTVLGLLPATQVSEARTAQDAADAISAHSPDLIIADWTRDPVEMALLVHRLRRGELGEAGTPVLAMAASTHHAVLEGACEAGADDVIAKPLSAMEIIASATALTSRRRSLPLAAE